MRVGLLGCMWICIHNMRQCVCVVWLRWLVSCFNRFLFVQEVVDATLLEKVETSIERSKSLLMLGIGFVHESVVDAVLKGVRGNTSLKKLTKLTGVFFSRLSQHTLMPVNQLLLLSIGNSISRLLLLSCNKSDHIWSWMLVRQTNDSYPVPCMCMCKYKFNSLHFH